VRGLMARLRSRSVGRVDRADAAHDPIRRAAHTVDVERVQRQHHASARLLELIALFVARRSERLLGSVHVHAQLAHLVEDLLTASVAASTGRLSTTADQPRARFGYLVTAMALHAVDKTIVREHLVVPTAIEGRADLFVAMLAARGRRLGAVACAVGVVTIRTGGHVGVALRELPAVDTLYVLVVLIVGQRRVRHQPRIRVAVRTGLDHVGAADARPGIRNLMDRVSAMTVGTARCETPRLRSSPVGALAPPRPSIASLVWSVIALGGTATTAAALRLLHRAEMSDETAAGIVGADRLILAVAAVTEHAGDLLLGVDTGRPLDRGPAQTRLAKLPMAEDARLLRPRRAGQERRSHGDHEQETETDLGHRRWQTRQTA